VYAQDAFIERWKELAGRQPEGVKFVITSPKTEFFFGEVIPLELQFTSARPRTSLADGQLQDRVGRLNYNEEFVAAPASISEDPLQGLQGGAGGMGGVSGPSLELVSNVLTLSIRPVPAAWVAEQIALAGKILDAPGSRTGQTAKERQGAIRVLRFIESPEAAQALLPRVTDGRDMDSFSAYMGVLASPYRKQLLPLMEQRLVAPDQPVWDRYLDTLAQMAELVASGGPMPPYPKDAAGQKAWQGEFKRRLDVRERAQTIVGMLARNLDPWNRSIMNAGSDRRKGPRRQNCED
jgi:hypothetical protein